MGGLAGERPNESSRGEHLEGTCTWVELSFTYTFDFSSIERVGLIVGGRGRPHPKMPTNREADPVLVNLEVGCVRLGFSESEIEVRESPETKATFEETTTFNVQTKTRRCARHALGRSRRRRDRLDSLLDRLWNRRVVEVDVEYVQLIFR